MLLPDAFENFIHCSVFNKMIFCLGEKQGMIVNDDCSSWYNRVHVGDFLMSVWERRKEICCMVRDQLVRFLRAAPLLSARPMATIARTVECERFSFNDIVSTAIYSFHKYEEIHCSTYSLCKVQSKK